MMADSSFDASLSAKMLMPHELSGAGASASANTASLVGQHSIHSAFTDLHHGTSSFYHSTTAAGASTAGGTAAAATSGYNGFHNSTFHHSYNNGGIGAASSFSTLVHQQQQPITLSNQHSITTVSATMPPPLILYNQPHHQTSSLYTNTLSNTNVVASRQLLQQQHQQPPLPPLLKSTEGATTKSAQQSTGSTANEEQQTTTEEAETPATGEDEMAAGEVAEEESEEPEIDIVISNVVCAFSVRCHLSLKHIALQGANVEFKRENGMVTMKLRKPYTTASIWSSGKITCTGATSEEQAKVAARRYARVLQKLNFRVRFQNYRVVNVLGTCKMPWAIKIVQFSEKYKKEASYEPELHPGVTYNLKNPTATLKIFSTGSMTVTARSVADVQAAIEHIYPLVYEFKKPRTEEVNGEKEEIYADIIETDIEMDDDEDDVDDDEDDEDDVMEDPLEDPLDVPDSPPPLAKKQKLRDVSHLTKRYKGPPTTTNAPRKTATKKQSRRGSKRPLGKMNDPKQDLIYVSDGDVDGDDF